jgi:hypothetical protein
LAAGDFFWLDLESLDPERLEQFGRVNSVSRVWPEG